MFFLLVTFYDMPAEIRASFWTDGNTGTENDEQTDMDVEIVI